MPTLRVIYSKENYTIIHRFGFELYYKDTLLFVSPNPDEAYEYIAWRKID